jgi:Cysteine-rich CPXCG
MKILFLHGWHSVPGGVKPTYLQSQAWEVINPAQDDDDFEAAVRAAQAEYDLHAPDVVVGSSRGGAVAMNIRSGNTPLVLLCPAWKHWGCVTRVKPNAMILHSRLDEVIPFEESEELVANSELPVDALVEVGSDHRLADEASLSVMRWACQLLTSNEPLPWADDVDLGRASRRGKGASQSEACYICDACGEEIVIPLDLSEGSSQQYIEDCPVCCRASIIHVEVDEDGNAQVWAEPEQDYE